MSDILCTRQQEELKVKKENPAAKTHKVTDHTRGMESF